MDKERIECNVQTELPFLALEKAMMLLTEEGADRQEAYEKIREIALAAKETQKRKQIDLESILASAFFDKVSKNFEIFTLKIRRKLVIRRLVGN